MTIREGCCRKLLILLKHLRKCACGPQIWWWHCVNGRFPNLDNHMEVEEEGTFRIYTFKCLGLASWAKYLQLSNGWENWLVNLDEG